MAARPSPELVAKWYARLPAGSNIEDARGRIRPDTPGGRALRPRRWSTLPLCASGKAAIAHDYERFGAASWRMPRIAGIVDVRGAGPHSTSGQFRRRLTLVRQRRILRMLADGASVRQVMAAVRTSPVVIVAVRKAALAWKDPDDAE